VPPGAAAWTLGGLVIVRTRHAGSEHLLAHELEHVRQYHEVGFVSFLVRYLLAYAVLRLRGYPHPAAYRRIPERSAPSGGPGASSASAPTDRSRLRQMGRICARGMAGPRDRS
jgi:hypothetical protein